MFEAGPDVRCRLPGLLAKWLDRGSFFFAHSNVFDTGTSPKAWRFAEFKVHDDRQQLGPYDHPSSKAGDGRRLSLVKMQFPYLLWNEGSRTLSVTDESYSAWSSDEIQDESVDLVKTTSGIKLGADHAARQDDRAYTCNQCHNRVFGTRADGRSGRLTLLPYNFSFRMVGFGFEPELGIPGQDNRGDFAPAFRDMLARDAAVF